MATIDGAQPHTLSWPGNPQSHRGGLVTPIVVGGAVAAVGLGVSASAWSALDVRQRIAAVGASLVAGLVTGIATSAVRELVERQPPLPAADVVPQSPHPIKPAAPLKGAPAERAAFVHG